MLRRLLLGLVLGLIVGGLMAAAVVAGLKMPAFAGGIGIAIAYAVSSLTGVLTGLVAGKPIWASGAKIEAGLKAVFGALLGAGLMFALRMWAASWTIDVGLLGAAGHGSVGELPAASLPLIAAVLGSFFELDNTGKDGAVAKAAPAKERMRTPAQAKSAVKSRRVAEPPGSEEGDDEEIAPSRAKR
jgi:hypothetical protein